MTTNDLLKSFLSLDDEAKKRVIAELKKHGYSEQDIQGLTWLATMSNDTTKELMFNN